MMEIEPISPYAPVVTVRKVERDEHQKKPAQKKPQPKPEQTDAHQPAEHVDEIV